MDMRLQHGFSLIEILVTLIILKIGLLGVLTAQTISLRQLQDAIQRTQATALSASLIYYIQSNSHLLQHIELPITLHTEPPSNVACNATLPCEPLSAGQYLLAKWFLQLEGAGGRSLNTPVICVQSAGSNVQLQVSWQQFSASATGEAQCLAGSGRSGFTVRSHGG